MSVFVWLLLGLVIGYLGRLIMRCEPDQGAVMSIAAGMLGAMTAGWLVAPRLDGIPGRGSFSSTAIAASLLGAVVLIGIANFLRYRRVR